MKFLLLSILLLATGALGEAPSERFLTADLNDYIDTIIPALREFIKNNLEPMPIPDLIEGFSVKPLFIEYHGELELTRGSLTGLTSLWRSGDFKVAYINKLLRVNGDFGFKDIGFTYDYLAKIMNIGPTGGVVGKVSKISGVLDMLIDFNNNEVHLQDFYLHDVGSITIKLTGNILVDWLSNAVAKVVTTLFKNVIVKIVESNLKDAIQNAIDNLNNSINGISRLMKDYPNYTINTVQTIPRPVQSSPMISIPKENILQKIMHSKPIIQV